MCYNAQAKVKGDGQECPSYTGSRKTQGRAPELLPVPACASINLWAD